MDYQIFLPNHSQSDFHFPEVHQNLLFASVKLFPLIKSKIYYILKLSEFRFQEYNEVLLCHALKAMQFEIATEYILSKIENYELKSEDIISDIKFAEELGMSRTPVREAIMSLIENGILERNRSKIVVKSIIIKRHS